MTPTHPVSIKGILFRDGRACLLRNDRQEWELPGGRLELGEQPETCLRREVREELGLDVEVREPLHTWLFEVIPDRFVFVVAYLCQERGQAATRLSDEHLDIGWFGVSELEDIPLPAGYAHAVRLGAPRAGTVRP